MKLQNLNNLLELFFSQYEKQDNKKILLSSLKDPNKNFSWEKTLCSIINLSNEISKHIKKGERCLLISENRPEWFISDLSIMLSGGITVPAYTTYIERDYEYIINDCKPSLIFVSNEDQFKKIKNILPEKDFIKKVFSFDNLNQINFKNYIHVENFFKEFDINSNKIPKVNIARKDPACIIYTSGTQGNPKGVILSHGGILNNCEGAYELIQPLLSEQTRFLTWLPLSHSYEHTVQFVQISVGAKIFYAEGIDKLLVNMAEAKPHIMTAVPRFYDSLYTRISQGLKKQSKVSQFFFKETLRLGKKTYFNEPLSFFEKKFNGLLNKIVRKKVNKRFGGSLKALVSGGAALNFEVGLYLSALGLPLLQGYGQTETAPVVSANPPNKIKLDTVGPVFKGTKVKIAEDGEILVSGENVMNGYWNDPKATSSTLINGWIHTGDIGELDEEGYLKITDRKKDIIVNAGGDNISPSRVEEKLNIEPEIAQSMMYGDFKNYLVAILVPDRDYTQEWAKDHHKEFNIKKLNQDSDFIKMIKTTTERVNKKLSQIEQVRKFLLIDEEFTVENKMMTPTLKVRRFKVKEKYQSQLEALY